MQAAKIKRGATFKATITFDEDEWAALYPWTSIEAEVGQGSRRYPLAVAVNASDRVITLTAATSTWLTQETGRTSAASFDVWVTRSGERMAIPASHNIPLQIIEGVTR